MSESRKTGFEPPPHENAATHARVMERLRTMTDDQFRTSMVRAGIIDEHGKLTEHYKAPKPGK